MSVFETCTSSVSENDNDQDVLRCISDQLQTGQTANAADITTWFLVYAAAMIFFMQAGFAMLCAGSVRVKNVGNTMLKNLLDACGASLGFWSVGYALAFGGSDANKTTFIGTANFFMIGLEEDYAFWLFQFAFAATSATIVAGTLAERCQMAAYLCYSVFLTMFVYPVVAHAVWSSSGFLSAASADPFLGIGMVDFAGSGVVHVTGGATAVFATMILGPRKGRFYDARGNPLPKPKPFPGHSVALQMLGTFILWFGWYGFNPGSALVLGIERAGSIAALAAVNTTLSASSAGVTALFGNLWYIERKTGEAKFDILVLMNGALGGLVAITGGCAVVDPWAAVLIGFLAGIIYLAGSSFLIHVKLDDAVDAIPVHLFNGMWGIIAVGFLAEPDAMEASYGSDRHVGWFYSLGRGSGDANLLVCQLLGLLFIIGWVFFLLFPFFIWLNYMGWFRADSLEELVGLDISYHGGNVLGNDEVKLEYVEAFNRRKGKVKPGFGESGDAPYGNQWDTQQETAMDEFGE
mmetsp:Transcript_45875/g.68284  ORF Transcript_45875/g.68284 Transcript_45875/m.68284 type:complete len:520 (-) Transcript_45875:141-1700(-)|eukprot:CAMPEP_0194041096 /NCGR_PEP_ID=MMETSP0009_2-20130614/12994_1 /TAXON_ID=210454 /ORGANISM="Grammatophora oceanica, Strain CCMP 410" /LENGTH=519 /DNA_ID=CAMNT_0038684449 /DNA_START=127 /DNA_END=1686 /DNA_ORIENTATION=+